MPLPHFTVSIKFKNNQKVMYIGSNPHVEATVFDPGITMTTIMIFSMDYESGTPNILTVDNNLLVDFQEYVINKRDENIDNIISHEQ